MANVDIEFNDKSVRKFITRLHSRFDTIKLRKNEFGISLTEIVVQDVVNHFRSASGPDGRWAPWSFLYAKRMRKLGLGSRRLLIASGSLLRAVALMRPSINPTGIQWITRGIAYASTHDLGTKKVPQRKFMWLSDRASNRMSELAIKFLMS